MIPGEVLVLAIITLTVGVMVWCGFLRPVRDVIWFFVRPVVVAFGSAPRTTYDYLVRGWKAERRGDWAAALAEYDRAIELTPTDPEPRDRRAALLAAHPELTEPPA